MTPPSPPQPAAEPPAPPPESGGAKRPRPRWAVLGKHEPCFLVSETSRPQALVEGAVLWGSHDGKIRVVAFRDGPAGDGSVAIEFGYGHRWDRKSSRIVLPATEIFRTRQEAAAEIDRRRIERFIAERIYGAVSRPPRKSALLEVV